MIEKEIKNFNAVQIAQSGQCFRMTQREDGKIETIASNHFLLIEQISEKTWRFFCSQEEFDTFWFHYFDLSHDYEEYWKDAKEQDFYLQKAINSYEGLRILNQDPWEMIVSFLISQRKSLQAIRGAVACLCEQFGTPFETQDGMKYTFPTPEQLKNATSEQLLACKLGYRVPYIQNAVQWALQQEDLHKLQRLPMQELRQKLMEIHGVGIKVAECIALFGYARLDAFPVDVWIQRVLKHWYQGEFPQEYQTYAGIFQQYLFCYARDLKLKD